MNWDPITQHLEAAIGQPFKISRVQPVGGGDINAAYRLQAEEMSFFVKLNRPEREAMFAAEFAGLAAMAATRTVRVPAPVTFGKTKESAFIVLEYLDLSHKSKHADERLGQQLAILHLQRQASFGWHLDNTIGSTPQLNGQYDDWITFWRERRLGFQLRLAAENGYSGSLQRKGEQLTASLPFFFDNYQPKPSLLHGDLWGGNASADSLGQPVLYDPACYFGDHEADLAMTELFGGFSAGFYAAYRETFPVDAGYAQRKILYNLYHILNHLNLFGAGYLRQAESMMSQLLAELK
jgi:protein-ribulosamine 3-kinase